MGRAKPKRQYSLALPEIEIPDLSNKQLDLLLEDLSISRRSARCESFTAALRQTIGRYISWTHHLKDIPSIGDQLAELRQLHPHLQASLDGLLALSPLAKNRLKHAYVDAGSLNPSRVEELECLVNRTIGDLAVLVGALKQADMNWAISRRGRHPEPVHNLIRELAALFARYDVDDHDDDLSARSACDAFVRHALKAFNIRHPMRLDSLLR